MRRRNECIAPKPTMIAAQSIYISTRNNAPPLPPSAHPRIYSSATKESRYAKGPFVQIFKASSSLTPSPTPSQCGASVRKKRMSVEGQD